MEHSIMPLEQRPIAITTAVFAFFTAGIVSAFCKNCPYTSCKRALIAMLAAYVFTTIVVKIINAVLVDAIVSKQVNRTLNRLKGKGSSRGNAD